jgi:hypothetical protein
MRSVLACLAVSISAFFLVAPTSAHAAASWDFIRVYEKSQCYEVGRQMVREKPYALAYKCEFFRNDQYKLWLLIKA